MVMVKYGGGERVACSALGELIIYTALTRHFTSARVRRVVTAYSQYFCIVKRMQAKGSNQYATMPKNMVSTAMMLGGGMST